MNDGKICVPVCAANMEGFAGEMDRAAEVADVIELRLDYLNEIVPEILWRKLKEIRKTFSGKILVTYRPKDQGGARAISNEQRAAFWSENSDLYIYEHADWADLEHDFDLKVGAAFLRALYKRLIWSFHDFDGVPENLAEIYAKLRDEANFRSAPPRENDLLKIAVRTNDVSDSLRLWKLFKDAPEGTLIPIAMGEAGKWTRILGPAFGAPLTYASLDKGGNAPGQIPAREMAEVYRVKELSRETLVYAIIGDPVTKSLSPYMHNAAFKLRGIDAVFMHMEVKDLDRFMREFVPGSGLNFGGFAVTMPHKETIIPYLDELDETARAIGAVNTVKFENGKLIGLNTDIYGVVEPLTRAYGDLKGARVAILGAGGAARACVYALRQKGARTTIFARNAEKTRAIAGVFGCAVGDFPVTELRSFDIVINATPLGMKPGQENFSLLTADRFGDIKLAFDLITKPAETGFMREAKKAGVETIGGLEMLIAQGVKQFEIWTGQDAPLEVMREAAVERL